MYYFREKVPVSRITPQESQSKLLSHTDTGLSTADILSPSKVPHDSHALRFLPPSQQNTQKLENAKFVSGEVWLDSEPSRVRQPLPPLRPPAHSTAVTQPAHSPLPPPPPLTRAGGGKPEPPARPTMPNHVGGKPRPPDRAAVPLSQPQHALSQPQPALSQPQPALSQPHPALSQPQPTTTRPKPKPKPPPPPTRPAIAVSTGAGLFSQRACHAYSSPPEYNNNYNL